MKAPGIRGALQAVRKAAAGLFSRRPSGPARSLVERAIGAHTEPPVRGTREFLEVHETSPWIRVIADRVADGVAATQWTLSRSDGRAMPRSHPMMTTLSKPNPFMTGHDLLRITTIHQDLVGDAFWLLERNQFGIPIGIWPLPPHWVADLPTARRPAYQVSWAGWAGDVPEGEVIRWPVHSVVDPYGRGAGIARSQADEIETHEYASKHAKSLFWNRAAPDMVVMDPAAGDEELAVHEKHWLDRLQGLYRAFKPYFVNRKLEFWQPQQMNLDNLTMVPLLKHERDMIQQAWGFPPEQLGIVENSNRANSETSDWILATRVIVPRQIRIRDGLQAWLAPQYDPRLVVGFVPTVPTDKEHRLQVMGKAPWAWAVDEWRRAAGDEPVGGELGQARLVPLNSYLATDPLDPAVRPAAGGTVASQDQKEQDTK